MINFEEAVEIASRYHKGQKRLRREPRYTPSVIGCSYG